MGLADERRLSADLHVRDPIAAQPVDVMHDAVLEQLSLEVLTT
jgi:hypothetical protein